MKRIDKIPHISLCDELRALIFLRHLALLLLLFSGLPAIAGADPLQEGPPARQTPILAFISDTQAPIWIETVALPEKGNKRATRLLFSDLRSCHPARVFVLGDLISLGFLSRAWEDIDRYVTDLRRDSVPVDAIMGNHELMLFSKIGEANFMALFPRHIRTGYVRSADSTAVILLNSNFSRLSKDEESRQMSWYAATLDSLQADPAIRGIIVCCHHSPFSNSKIVGSSVEVQRAFIPLYLATPKCLLFLSGHAHTFEHFQFKGKDFLVIGGGGGLNHPLYQGEEERWKDLSPLKPLFHYITARRESGTLHIVVRGIMEEGSTAVGNMYELEIPYRASPTIQPSVRTD